MVFSLQAIVIAVTVSTAKSGFLPDCIPRVARARRSIRSRHYDMNEPIESVQPVVLLKEPVEINIGSGGGNSVLDRIDARINGWWRR